MKKVMLGLVMVVMLMSMVGCGTTKTLEDKKDGFVPEQVTESEIVVDEVVEEVIDTENLQKYYDTEKYLGTPTFIDVMRIQWSQDNEKTMIAYCTVSNSEGCSVDLEWEIARIPNLKGSGSTLVQGIICDNETPDDYSDDVVVYIFTN